MNSKIIFLVCVFISIFVLTFITGITENFRGYRRYGHRRGWRRNRRHRMANKKWIWGWGPSYYPFGRGGGCKNGCVSLGNNRWGCQYPGNGYNDCMFSDDCTWCGDTSPRRWWW